MVFPDDEAAAPSGQESASIRVLLVDDDALARTALTMMLGTTADLDVVGECTDGSQLNEALAALRPDVVLMDIRMPQVDGVTAVRRAQGLGVRTNFLMMTALDDDGRVVDAIEAGAAGFLLKDDDPRTILRSIRDVAAGESAFSPRSASHLTRWVRDSTTPPARADAQAKMAMLTEREREIAVALVSGPSDAELAATFFVAVSTIKSTLSIIKTKWGVRNRTQIAVLVERSGLA